MDHRDSLAFERLLPEVAKICVLLAWEPSIPNIVIIILWFAGNCFLNSFDKMMLMMFDDVLLSKLMAIE